MAKTKRIRLLETAIAGKPDCPQTEYFSDEHIDFIVMETAIPLNGMVSVISNGHKRKISRKNLLKRELNEIAHYWRGKLSIQLKVNKDELPTLPPYPKRKKDDYLFGYLVAELEKLWIAPKIFNQKKAGISIPSPGGKTGGSRKAGGPFVRFVIACCNVLKIDRTTDAIRPALRKWRAERLAEEKEIRDTLGLSLY